MRRFYQTVATAPGPGGFGLLLDGKPVKTPDKQPLAVPTQALADAIAGEWRAQAEDIRPETMPLTQLANTAADRTAHAMDRVAQDTIAYAGSDLLCYRADRPADLAALQGQHWQPHLDWAIRSYEAPFTVTYGIMQVHQPQAVPRAIAAVVRPLDPYRLTGLAHTTRLLGSIVLALALRDGRLDGDRATDLSQLDEDYQARQWGRDAEAQRARAALAAELRAADRFFRALEPVG